MYTETLRIIRPDRFPECGDCPAATALLSRYDNESAQSLADELGMDAPIWLSVNCNDRVTSTELVPNIHEQTAMQILVKDKKSSSALNEPKIVNCAGKLAKRHPQNQQLP